MNANMGQLVGRVLGRRYRLERPLGAGGMGAVFEATQLDLGRTVAVKVLLDVDARGIARLRQEALTAGSLSCPHVISIFDFQALEGEPPFIVMEILPGHSLATLLKHEPVLPVARAARIACQMLIGLEAAHRAGVVHRDVKPSNTWLVFGPGIEEHVKMLDFGIAKMLGGDGSLHTTTGSVVGTPGYLSPEQLRGAPLDARVDIHAMGVVLFEMLTGARPWRADTAAVYAEILERQPPPVHAMVPDIPLGLSQAVSRALAKNPDERFGRAADMRIALAPFAAHGTAAPTFMGALGSPTGELRARSMPATPPSTVGESRPSLGPDGQAVIPMPSTVVAPTAKMGASTALSVSMAAMPEAHSMAATFLSGYPATTGQPSYSSTAGPTAASPACTLPASVAAAPTQRSSMVLPLVIGGGFVLLAGSGLGAAFLLKRSHAGPDSASSDRSGAQVASRSGAQVASSSSAVLPASSPAASAADAGARIADTPGTASGTRGLKVPTATPRGAAVDASALSASVPADAIAARCSCVSDAFHRRVCTTAMPPSCSCNGRGNVSICSKPWVKGDCPVRVPGGGAFGGAGHKDGEVCSGFEDHGDDKPHPASGTLDCTFCYGSGTVPGVPGGPCRGVDPDGQTVDGHLSCDK